MDFKKFGRIKGTAVKDPPMFVVAKWIFFIIFALYAASMLFPFFWMFLNTFKSNTEFITDCFAWPTDFSYFSKNFQSAFSMSVQGSNVWVMAGRTVYLSIACTIAEIISPLGISYACAHYKFPGRQVLIMLGFGMVFIPGGSLAATFETVVNLGLYNNPLVLIIMASGGFGLNFMICYGAFKSLDPAYFEAASIDGANDLTQMFKIAVPLIMPSLVPIAILSFIGEWNSYYAPYMYCRQSPTLAVGIQLLVEQEQYNPNTPALFAVMLLSCLPVILLFIIFQKPIIQNVSAGGIKG